MDLYPVKDKNTIPFNKWKWFAIAVSIAVLFLWYKTCHPTQQHVIPDVIPPQTQIENVRVDSVISQKAKDSIDVLLKKERNEKEVWYAEWKASEIRYADLEKEVIAGMDKPVPDTCKEIKDYYVKQIKSLSVAANKGAIACEKTIKAQDAIIVQKDALIKQGKLDYGKLKVNFDTCISQQKKLSSAIKNVQSKNELYAGIMALGNETKPVEGFGVSLGLRTKNGTQFEVFALQFNSGIHYGLSYKKPFAKFK